MTTRTYTIETDTFEFRLNKQDKTNTDEVEVILPNSATIAINDEVVLKLSDGTTFFTGLVQNLKNGNGRKIVTVWDYGAELLQRTVNTVFTSQSPEAIIQSVISSYAPSLTYVSTISSGITISTYVANKKRAWDIVSEMAELLLANFYVDQNKNFKLELEGSTTITSLQINSDNAILDGFWKSDASQIINSVTVDGDDRQIFERDPELFSGTGSQTQFTLAEIPVALKVEYPVGTILTGYTEGATTGDYQIDRETKTITFDSPPALGTDNIKVTYTVGVPISSRRRDFASISTYGQKDKVFKKIYIKTRTEARKFAEFIINRYKDPLEESTWILDTSSSNNINTYLPNSYIFINDTQNSKSGYYIIREVNWEFPGQFKIKVGTPTEDIVFWQKEIQQKVKQLEEKDDNSTILNEDEYVEENLLMEFDVDIVDIKKRTYDVDQYYWSNSSTSRNQWTAAGTGALFRNVANGNGYTEEDILGFSILLSETSTDEFITEGGDTLILESNPLSTSNSSAVSVYPQNLGRSNFLTSIASLISHIGVGDNNTTPTESDTTLGNQTTREATFTEFSSSTSASFTIFLDTADNNGNNIEEIGLFDASTGGNMYVHSLTNVTVKTSSIEYFGEVRINVSLANDSSLQ